MANGGRAWVSRNMKSEGFSAGSSGFSVVLEESYTGPTK